jgi:hypothetical protein
MPDDRQAPQLRWSSRCKSCHRNDQLIEGGGTAILVRRVIHHHAVSVKGLAHLEATAIQVMLASKPVNIPEVFFHHRPLIASDLSA